MNWFFQGGWPMYPILICSIITLAAIIERTIVFIITSENPSQIVKNAKKDIYINRKGIFSSAMSVYATENKLGKEEFEERLHLEGSKVLQTLSRRIGLLGVIAHLTPLMGLFGTVLGMIGVFKGLHDGQGRAGISSLAGGISIALLTTAFGLAVAIPSFAAHNLFDSIIRRRAEALENFLPILNRMYNRNITIDSSQNIEDIPKDNQ